MADKLDLQHFKDEVAKLKNLKDWGQVHWHYNGFSVYEIEGMLSEAAERHAKYCAFLAWHDGYSSGITDWVMNEETDNPYKQKEN